MIQILMSELTESLSCKTRYKTPSPIFYFKSANEFIDKE
jgi:hypothetical protein